MPCIEPKEIPTTVTHSTDNCGIYYVPDAVLGTGNKEMDIIGALLPLNEFRVLLGRSEICIKTLGPWEYILSFLWLTHIYWAFPMSIPKVEERPCIRDVSRLGGSQTI